MSDATTPSGSVEPWNRPDPDRLVTQQVSLEELIQAVERNNGSAGGGYIVREKEQRFIHWFTLSDAALLVDEPGLISLLLNLLRQENPDEDTSTYPNPGAVLQVTKPGEAPQTAYAFGAKMASMPVASKPIGGYTYQLTDFEKVSDQHILSVQRDPGAAVVYVGFILLCLTLIAVFFFSHQRVWAAIEPAADGRSSVVLGGNTNRSINAFDEKFKRFSSELGSAQ